MKPVSDFANSAIESRFFLCLKRKWIETETYKLCFEKYLRFLLSLKKWIETSQM
ncbi:hypothetical protein LEP1GSC170_1572 [Leptospira interrogans serovar Bataviae str. HAI135]|nr:hypothetical protein LEP1GSC170_1572 [Leptospira interrogans serovar Bataviae str. HAI135]